jgi:hypothetical protein
MKSAHALLLAAVATLGLVGVGANLQPATAMPASTVFAQTPPYTETKMTIDWESETGDLVNVYRRTITRHGVLRTWYVGETSSGDTVLLTYLDTSTDNLISALTPTGQLVEFH